MNISRGMAPFNNVSGAQPQVGFSSQFGFCSHAVGMGMTKAAKKRRNKNKLAKKARRKNR